MATLTWQREGGAPLVFDLTGSEMTLGRDPASTARIESSYVSKRHAVIRLTPTGYVIADEGSSNGTTVNGRRITTVALSDGDTIELGGERLVFREAAAGSGSKARRLIFVGGVTAVVGLLFAAVIVWVGGPAPAGAPAPGAREAGGALPGPASASAPAEPGPDLAVAAAPTAADQRSESGEAPDDGRIAGTAALIDASGRVLAVQAGSTSPPSDAGAADLPQPSPETPSASSPAPAAPASGAAASAVMVPQEDAGVLYDLALAHVRGGRLVHARQLLLAAVIKEPNNPSMRQRLREVEAAIQVAIDRHLSAGQRAFTYLRYQDAILDWEQVVAMTEPSDARHRQAREGLAQARVRLKPR